MISFAKKIFPQTWHLDDVRQIARENPYTYYVPSEKMLNMLKVAWLLRKKNKVNGLMIMNLVLRTNKKPLITSGFVFPKTLCPV